MQPRRVVLVRKLARLPTSNGWRVRMDPCGLHAMGLRLTSGGEAVPQRRDSATCRRTSFRARNPLKCGVRTPIY